MPGKTVEKYLKFFKKKKKQTYFLKTSARFNIFTILQI